MIRFLCALVLLFSSSVFAGPQCSLQLGQQATSLYMFGTVKIAEIAPTFIWFDSEVGNIIPSDPQQISPTSFNYNSLYRLTDQAGAVWYFRFSGEWFDSANTQRTLFYAVQWAWGKYPVFPGRYTIETIDSPRTQTGPIRVSTIGDSMTWFGDAQSLRCRLAAYLPGHSFIGSRTDSYGFGHDGHGGDNTADILARINAVPVSDIYILMAGSNDGGYTPEETAQNIETITDRLLDKNGNAKIYVNTLPPRGDQYADLAPLRNAAIRNWYSLSMKKNNIILIDTDMAMNAIPGAMSRFISADKIHPSKEGYDFITKFESSAINSQFAITTGQ